MKKKRSRWDSYSNHFYFRKWLLETSVSVTEDFVHGFEEIVSITIQLTKVAVVGVKDLIEKADIFRIFLLNAYMLFD